MSEHTPPVTLQQLKQQHRHAAFTILELMVVMMIMGVVMSIGIGALMSSTERNTRVATERLISGYINQARQRSVALNKPMIVRIRADTNSISGISHLRLIDQYFEWSSADIAAQLSASSPALPTAPDVFLMPFGNSGYGWQSNSLMLKALTGKYKRPLIAEAGDGFNLSCAVKAPAITSTSDNIIPLLLISAVESPENDLRSAAYAGIQLWRIPQFLHDAETDTHIRVGYIWGCVAWANTAQRPYPTDPNDYTLWNNFLTSIPCVRDWTILANENTQPYVGDSWVQYSLTFDGSDLVVARNGQDVAYSTNVAIDIPVATPVQLIVARASDGTSAIPRMSAATIDDISLTRIGSQRNITLPSSVVPQHTYQLLINNAAIDCYQIDPSTNSYTRTDTLNFSADENDNTASAFSYRIDSDGTLTLSTAHSSTSGDE